MAARKKAPSRKGTAKGPKLGLIPQAHGGAMAPPIKPGEVRNPKGHNQYTKRQLATEAIDEKITAGLAPEEVVAPLVEALRNPYKSRQHTELAKFALERLWPGVVKHELTGRDGGAIEVDGASSWAQLGAELASIDDVPRRGNGKANGSRSPGHNGSGEAAE